MTSSQIVTTTIPQGYDVFTSTFLYCLSTPHPPFVAVKHKVLKFIVHQLFSVPRSEIKPNQRRLVDKIENFG